MTIRVAMIALVAFVGHSFATDAHGAKTMAQLKKLYKRPKGGTPYPKDNKRTKAREDLGWKLFFEPRLSGSQVMSCATCHNPSLGWEDGNPLAVGHGHKILGRKTPTILNLAWAPRLFWDGRASSLEEQALGPIEAAGEMNMALEDAEKRLSKIEGYKPLFKKAYGTEKITKDLIGKAIATYERKIVSKNNSPFDRFIAGNNNAISRSARNGFKLFNEKANCAACHSGWAMTDHGFHDIGVDDDDEGRYAHLKLPSMKHAFKTPTLRNIDQRGPYLHNGSEETLMDVVEFYNRGGKAKRDSLSPNVRPLNLTQSEKQDLVAFMKTLTSKDDPVTLPILPQ